MRRIIKPPIIETESLCFFNFPSGLSKKIKNLEIVSNLIKITKLNKIINDDNNLEPKNKEYFKSIIDSSNIIGNIVYKDKLFKDVDTKISNYDTFTIFSRASTAANIEKQII